MSRVMTGLHVWACKGNTLLLCVGCRCCVCSRWVETPYKCRAAESSRLLIQMSLVVRRGGPNFSKASLRGKEVSNFLKRRCAAEREVKSHFSKAPLRGGEIPFP